MRKVIVSEFITLDGVMEAPNEWSFPFWNDEIAKFKFDLIAGSGELIRTLMQHGIIDQYQLLVYPVVRGTGKRLFKDGNSAALKLVEAKPYDSGVVLLCYQPSV